MALSNWPLRVCHCEFVVLSTFKYGICQFASMLKGHCPPRFCGLLLAARHFKHCRISYSFILLAIRIKLRVRERGIFGSVIFARKTFRGKHGYLSPTTKKEGEITLHYFASLQCTARKQIHKITPPLFFSLLLLLFRCYVIL